jgi:hypothetical protein
MRKIRNARIVFAAYTDLFCIHVSSVLSMVATVGIRHRYISIHADWLTQSDAEKFPGLCTAIHRCCRTKHTPHHMTSSSSHDVITWWHHTTANPLQSGPQKKSAIKFANTKGHLKKATLSQVYSGCHGHVYSTPEKMPPLKWGYFGLVPRSTVTWHQRNESHL